MSHLSLAKRREKVVKKGRRWYGWMDGGGSELQQFPRPANGPNLWRLTLVALPPPTMNGTFNITPLKGITGMYLLLLKH